MISCEIRSCHPPLPPRIALPTTTHRKVQSAYTRSKVEPLCARSLCALPNRFVSMLQVILNVLCVSIRCSGRYEAGQHRSAHFYGSSGQVTSGERHGYYISGHGLFDVAHTSTAERCHFGVFRMPMLTRSNQTQCGALAAHAYAYRIV